MPLLSAKDWLDIGKDIAIAVIGPAAGYLGARHKQSKERADQERRWDEGAARSVLNEKAIRDHDQILAEHTLLHKMYVPNFASQSEDIKIIRDCVNRIAGKLDIDGTS